MFYRIHETTYDLDPERWDTEVACPSHMADLQLKCPLVLFGLGSALGKQSQSPREHCKSTVGLQG